MSSHRGSLRIAATSDVIDAVFVIDQGQLTVSTGEETLGSWPLTELAPDDIGTHVLLSLDGEQVVIDVPDQIAFVAALESSGGKQKRRGRRKPKTPREPKSDRKRNRKRKPKPQPKPQPEPETELEPEPPSPPTPRPESGPAMALQAMPSPEPAPVLEPDPIPEVLEKPGPVLEPDFSPGPASVSEPDPIPEPSLGRMPKPEAKHRARRRSRGRGKRDATGALRNLVDRQAWERRREDPVSWLVLAVIGAIGVLALAVFATKTLGMILVLLGMVTLVIVALAVSEDLTAYSWIPGSISETTLIIAGIIAMVVGGLLIWIG